MKPFKLCHLSSYIQHASGWQLHPEGAVVFEAEGVAVIADVHLGYEWARGRAGDLLPAHTLDETLAKLTTLFDRVRVGRLVVAGDLVESPRPCRRTERDVASLVDWLSARGASLVALQGNHDPLRKPALPATLDVGGWTIGHGDGPIKGTRTIFGHHHPVFRASGTTAPCFLVGARTIVLPAFSKNAAGLAVHSRSLPPALRKEPLRCWASTGDELLDFGLIRS